MTDRALLEAIDAGDVDDHLTALVQAVYARREPLHTTRSATALPQRAELLGDLAQERRVSILSLGSITPRARSA
jgi:hypothetical protein